MGVHSLIVKEVVLKNQYKGVHPLLALQIPLDAAFHFYMIPMIHTNKGTLTVGALFSIPPAKHPPSPPSHPWKSRDFVGNMFSNMFYGAVN